MNTNQLNDKIRTLSLTIETQLVRDGRKLGPVQPNSEGYIQNFPCMVLGTPSRNGSIYDLDTVIKELAPGSLFHTTLSDGGLYGEADHPEWWKYDLNTPQGKVSMVNRMLTIDSKYSSHHISKISTGEQLSSGGKILMMDFKPTSNPHGSDLRTSLNEPKQNVSFSLRSLSDRTQNPATREIVFNVKRIITFDWVRSPPGYREASKLFRNTPSNEALTAALESIGMYSPDKVSGDMSLTFDIVPSEGSVSTLHASVESIVNSDLNDIHGTNNIKIGKVTIDYAYSPNFVNRDKRSTYSLYQSLIRG